MKFVDDCCHDVQDLGLSCIENIAIIIHQDCLEKWRYHVDADHFQVICFLDIGINELENFLFDCPKTSDSRCFGRDVAYTGLVRSKYIVNISRLAMRLGEKKLKFYYRHEQQHR